MLRAVKLWQHRLRGHAIAIKADNVIALGMAHQLCAGSVSLRYLVAELSVPRFEGAEDRGEKPQSSRALGQLGTDFVVAPPGSANSPWQCAPPHRHSI